MTMALEEERFRRIARSAPPGPDHPVDGQAVDNELSHVELLGTASIDRPQQAGIPCIAAALATAIEQHAGIQPSS